jgi:hypothetical protein
MKNIMLVVFALVLVSSMALAQSSVVTTISIDAASATLALVNVDGGAQGVIRGVSYTVVEDPYTPAAVISPIKNGETATDVGVDITGDLSSSIVVDFDLPSELLGDGGTTMAITFPSSGPGSGVRIETGGFFNPNVSNTFSLGNLGLCGLRLGYTFTVPANTAIAADHYIGNILVTAYYTGL